MDFKNLLNSIPTLSINEEIPITIEDIQLEHESLTQDNPLTWIIYLDRCKTLTIDERNNIFKIISKLYANQQVIKQTKYNGFEESCYTIKEIEQQEQELKQQSV